MSTNSGASIVRHEVGLANVLPDSLFHDPAHPTRHGHAFVAQGVAAMLEELRIFTPLEE